MVDNVRNCVAMVSAEIPMQKVREVMEEKEETLMHDLLGGFTSTVALVFQWNRCIHKGLVCEDPQVEAALENGANGPILAVVLEGPGVDLTRLENKFAVQARKVQGSEIQTYKLQRVM